ncbi:helix-turn-helix domain-containing protein [Mucilaginibacter sp. X4EP1]|uniref:helix-turn-helix domain-containing protein n=1 Tax=Mucilaginibacter sp. X4EP1 TaxID=2723092 RepID=UPI0021693B43|nr:helix-turn-helix domain-containing protein [Mucilaginibacter sp. X4EP1]MCS3815964.1 AraC-like DNA-binding protein [Mucilaginibacter sp. X4EP1]
MNIHRFSPSATLKPFIREYLIIEADEAIKTNTIPDTSIVLSFRISGEVSRANGTEKCALPLNAVAGLRNSSREFYYAQQTINLLVLLNEGGIKAFSKMPAHELFCESISTDNLFAAAELSLLSEQLAEKEDNNARVKVIEAFLIRKLIDNTPDMLIHYAVNSIKQQNGLVNVKDLVKSLPISLDPFEKRFRAVIGTTPKRYAGIIRLRNLISNRSAHNSLTETSLEAGYFDQAHFIKDFRLFTGQSPKDFFRLSRYW